MPSPDIDERHCPNCGHEVVDWETPCRGCGQIPWETPAGQRVIHQRRRHVWLVREGPVAVFCALVIAVAVAGSIGFWKSRQAARAKLQVSLTHDRATGESQLALEAAPPSIEELETQLRELERTLDPHALEIAAHLEQLGDRYVAEGKPGHGILDAELAFKRALNIRELVQGAEHPAVADLLDRLAYVYYGLGKYEQVEESYRRALSIREKHFGPAHLQVAVSLEQLAARYPIDPRDPRFQEGIQLYERALAIREQAQGPMHHTLVPILNTLSFLASQEKRYERSEQLLKRVEAIQEQLFGANDPYLLATHESFVRVYLAQERYDLAEHHARRNIEIRQAQERPNLGGIAYAVGQLASAYAQMQRFDEAEREYLRAIEIAKQAGGQSQLAMLMERYALFVLHELGRTEDEARVRAETAQILNDYAKSLEQQGDVKRAREAAASARRIAAGPYGVRAHSSKVHMESAAVTWRGLTAEEATDTLVRKFQLDRFLPGVIVVKVEPNSAAALAGLRVGDLIQQINHVPVDAAQECISMLEQARGNVLIRTHRGHVVVKDYETLRPVAESGSN